MTGDRRIRIVIADDDPTMCSALHDFLDAEPDLTVVGVAGDAVESAAISVRTCPDVAILDVRMPGGGGQAAARSIGEQCPQVAMIVLTARGDDLTRADMLARGVSQVLVKGGDPEELLATVRRVAGDAHQAAAPPRSDAQ